MAPHEAFFEVTVDGAQIYGPAHLDQIRQWMAAGQLPPQSYLRWPGTQQWVPAVNFLGAPNAHPPPPPPPPAAGPSPAPSPENGHAGQLSALDQRIREGEERLNTLKRELGSVEEAIEIQSFGFYRPRYGFESSQEYVDRLKTIREEQKQLIKANQAAVCEIEWVVGGSAAEGRRMVQQKIKLMLRAFNGECDAAIAKVKYDNVLNLENRITKSFHDINKLGEVDRIEMTEPYHLSKLAELHLVHEHREKVHQEKEEQRRIKEKMREEQRAQEEIERVQAEAAKEEAQSQKALEKARAELAEATGRHHEKMEALVIRLENELKSALDRKVRAMARAQLTRSGHVYVLSNIGSFGPGVFKIGMTRRFEPLERVDELGDASVPFPFDVHAIIYSEDAPNLETALHREFTSRRVNMVNTRKEYFQVTLDEIMVAVEKYHGMVTFVVGPEAEEYRKTQALLDDAAASAMVASGGAS